MVLKKLGRIALAIPKLIGISIMLLVMSYLIQVFVVAIWYSFGVFPFEYTNSVFLVTVSIVTLLSIKKVISYL